MIDNMSQNKRLLIAIIIATVFFIAYDFLMPKPVKTPQQTPAAAEQSALSSAGQSSAASAASNQAPGQSGGKIIAELKSAKWSAKIDEQGQIAEFLLTSERYTVDGKPTAVIAQSAALRPLAVRFYAESSRPNFAAEYAAKPYEIEQIEELGIKLKKTIDGVAISKIIRFDENGFYTAEMAFSAPAPAYVITPGERPNVLADGYTVHGGMIYRSDETKTDYEDGDIKPNAEEIESGAHIAALSDRYYTTAMFDFAQPFEVIFSANAAGNTIAWRKAAGNAAFAGYIGAKEHKTLQARDERLANVVEYGWFTFIAKPMFSLLNFIHNHTGNWGWAIVIMTIIIRLILFPLTFKGMVSMKKLQTLAPKIKELQQKYKGDPAKMQTHMMELYKKHGANPLGGCLPILLQIPIFFAIYRVLLNAIELKAAPWALWISDLAAHDPYYILPIFMGATMFLQQLITPMSIQDPMQAKIMKFLPLVFVIFFISFPAGLTLYWCVNNTFSLAQQLVINKIFKNKESKK